MAKAIFVANTIIDESKKIGHSVSNLTLQKSMYFLNAMYLVQFKRPLITDEKFEKWAYGPVIHSIYSLYSKCGANTISNTVSTKKEYELRSDGSIKIIRLDEQEQLNTTNLNFIRKNLLKIIKKKPFDLVKFSHEEPQWQDQTSLVYNNNLTRKYYSNSNNCFWVNDNE